MNPVTTEYIDPFYVQKISVSTKCKWNSYLGERICKHPHNIFTFHGDISTSQNPSISFKAPEFTDAITILQIEVVDSDDNVYKKTEQIL